MFSTVVFFLLDLHICRFIRTEKVALGKMLRKLPSYCLEMANIVSNFMSK